jgi:hypothetical protein
MARLLLLVFALLATAAQSAKDQHECEVCIAVVDKVRAKLTPEIKKDIVKIEDALGKYCVKPANEKEGKLVSTNESLHVAEGVRPGARGQGCGPPHTSHAATSSACPCRAVLLHRPN